MRYPSNSVLKRHHRVSNIPPFWKNRVLLNFLVTFNISVSLNILILNNLLDLNTIQICSRMKSLFLLRHSNCISEIHKLLHIATPGKNRLTQPQLSQNASNTPHIDRIWITCPQNDFRSSIVPRLKILIYLLAIEASSTKINDFNAHFSLFLQNNVFRFEIAMDNFLFSHKIEWIQHLDGKQTDLILIKTVVVIGKYQLVKISIKQFEYYTLCYWENTMCLRKIVKSLILTIPLIPALSC